MSALLTAEVKWPNNDIGNAVDMSLRNVCARCNIGFFFLFFCYTSTTTNTVIQLHKYSGTLQVEEKTFNFSSVCFSFLLSASCNNTEYDISALTQVRYALPQQTFTLLTPCYGYYWAASVFSCPNILQFYAKNICNFIMVVVVCAWVHIKHLSVCVFNVQHSHVSLLLLPSWSASKEIWNIICCKIVGL